MQRTNTKCVIIALDLAFKTHGYSQCLKSENGQPFSSNEFQGYIIFHGIVQVKGILYRP